MPSVSLREFFLENFAGDLEYHPRQGLVYLGIAAASFCFFVFSARNIQFTVAPLVFFLGSLALLVKGIFLFRTSSEGLGLYDHEIRELSQPGKRKTLPAIATQFMQLIQDFGTGPLLLWPLLRIGKDIDKAWGDPPSFRVFVVGGVFFLAGFALRRFTSSKQSSVESK